MMTEKQPSAEALETAKGYIAEGKFSDWGKLDYSKFVGSLAAALDAFAARHCRSPSATALDIVRGIKRAGFAADEERHASEIDAFAARSRREVIAECAQEASDYYCPAGDCGKDIADRIRELALPEPPSCP